MEMADCSRIPDNLHDPLLERIFKAADTIRMNKEVKHKYMLSILGEAEYEANLEDWKEDGLEEGRIEGIKKGMAEGKAEIIKNMKSSGLNTSEIARITGLKEDEINDCLRYIETNSNFGKI